MRFITLVLTLIVLIYPQISVSKENDIFGVWKNTKYPNHLQTIEIRPDGSYIVCDGGWHSVNGKKVQRVTSIRHKIKNSELLTLTGYINNSGIFNHDYKDHPVAYKQENGKLTLSPAFLKKTTYERLKSKDFSAYVNTLTLYGNGISLPDSSLQEKLEKISQAKQSKTAMLLNKRKGKLVKMLQRVRTTMLYELDIEGMKIKVGILSGRVRKGDMITWVGSKKDIYEYPDAYSLYDAQPFKGKLATRDPANKAIIVEVFPGKNTNTYKADMNGELVLLLTSKTMLGDMQIKPKDTVTWAEGRVGKGWAPIPNPDKLLEMYISGIEKNKS